MKISIFVLTLLLLSTNLKDIGFNLQLMSTVSAFSVVYEKCGESRFCFGVDPSNNACIDTGNCIMVGSILVQNTSNVANLRIEGTLKDSEAWIGLGFSDDTIMGKDLVVACVRNKDSSGQPVTHSSFFWNPDGAATSDYINPTTETNGATITLKEYSSTNGKFYCEVETSTKIKYKSTDFDLVSKKYHVLLAMGGPPSSSS